MEKKRTHACVRVPEHILGSIAVDCFCGGSVLVGSNQVSATTQIVSNPETWVTECTGYLGDNLGPKGLSSGSSIEIEVAQIIIHKADQLENADASHGHSTLSA